VAVLLQLNSKPWCQCQERARRRDWVKGQVDVFWWSFVVSNHSYWRSGLAEWCFTGGSGWSLVTRVAAGKEVPPERGWEQVCQCPFVPLACTV